MNSQEMHSGSENVRQRNYDLYIYVMIVGLICSFFAFNTVEEKGLYVGDSVQYVRLAKNLVEHQTFSLEDHTNDTTFYPTMARLPGFPAVLVAISLVFGDSVWNYAILNLLAHILTSLLIVWLALKAVGRIPALIAGILCVTHTTSLFHAMTIESEITTNFLIILMISIYVANKQNFRYWRLVGMGLLSGLVALYREPVAPVLILAVLSTGIDWHEGFMQCAKKFTIFMLLMSVPFVPWIMRNYYISKSIVPITIFANGAGVNVKKMQDHGHIGLSFSPDFWIKHFNTESLVLDNISKRVGYDYFILSGNLQNKSHLLGNNEALVDATSFFPEDLFQKIKNDDSLSPTIKIELLYTELCKRFSKSISQDKIPITDRIFLTFKRLIYLYVANDTSPHQNWKYGRYFHRAVQFRWYFVESILFAIGFVAAFKSGYFYNYLAFVIAYTALVLFKFHIEARYALLPIALIKIWTGYGLYTLGLWCIRRTARRTAS